MIFKDAEEGVRCQAAILLRDGSGAQCGRARVVGPFCTQHGSDTVELADGFNGSTARFFSQPLERCGDGTVKLACAEEGKHYLIRWARK